jgi:hypothetical protein
MVGLMMAAVATDDIGFGGFGGFWRLGLARGLVW